MKPWLNDRCLGKGFSELSWNGQKNIKDREKEVRRAVAVEKEWSRETERKDWGLKGGWWGEKCSKIKNESMPTETKVTLTLWQCSRFFIITINNSGHIMQSQGVRCRAAVKNVRPLFFLGVLYLMFSMRHRSAFVTFSSKGAGFQLLSALSRTGQWLMFCTCSCNTRLLYCSLHVMQFSALNCLQCGLHRGIISSVHNGHDFQPLI